MTRAAEAVALVGRADEAQVSATARDALSHLLSRYLPALRAHLVLERRLDSDAADDLLQGFVADHILEKNLLAHAQAARGRFRSFLLACLWRYAAMQSRREAAAGRHPGHGKLASFASMGDATEELIAETGHGPAAEAFERAWAGQVVAEAVRRMREECQASLRPDLWALFEGRVLHPATEGTKPLAYPVIVERFGFASVAQATNALVTAKRMFARSLRGVVAEYVEIQGDEKAVKEELAKLRAALARGGSGGGGGDSGDWCRD